MKRFVVLFFFAAITFEASGSTESELKETIDRLLANSNGLVEGFDIHQLSSSGDAVAATALRILDPKKSLSEEQVSCLVWMIDASFYDVDLIENADNRVPGVSLFFLTHIAKSSYSPSLKSKIANTTEHLMAVRSRVLGKNRLATPPSR